MNKANSRVGLIEIGLGIAMLVASAGCVGYVDGGGGGVAVVAPAPEVTIFGGGFERGRDVHAYSARGAVSRGGGRGGRR